MNKLKKVFIHYDRQQNGNEIKGYVSKKVCKQVFQQYWPNKSDSRIKVLLKVCNIIFINYIEYIYIYICIY